MKQVNIIKTLILKERSLFHYFPRFQIVMLATLVGKMPLNVLSAGNQLSMMGALIQVTQAI